MTSVSWVPPRRPTLTGCFVVSWEPYTFSARLWTLLRSLPFTNSAQDTRWGSGVFFFSISDTRLSTTCVFHASMHLLQAEQPGNHFLWDLLQSLHVLTVCLWPFSCKSSFSLRSGCSSPRGRRSFAAVTLMRDIYFWQVGHLHCGNLVVAGKFFILIHLATVADFFFFFNSVLAVDHKDVQQKDVICSTAGVTNLSKIWQHVMSTLLILAEVQAKCTNSSLSWEKGAEQVKITWQ